MYNYNPTGITCDADAEDLLNQIEENEAERERLLSTCRAQIEKYSQRMEDINLRFDNAKAPVVAQLGEYARQNANKHTKTTDTYMLPTARLVWKKREPEFIRDDKLLLQSAKSICPEYVKVKQTETVDWKAIKATAHVLEGEVLMMNAEMELVPLEGVTVQEREPEFIIETQGE